MSRLAAGGHNGESYAGFGLMLSSGERRERGRQAIEVGEMQDSDVPLLLFL